VFSMSARKKTTINRGQLAAETPVLAWIGAIGIALFLLIFPFDRALFNGYELSFDEPIYNALIYSFFLLLAVGAYTLKGWKLNTYRGIMSIVIMLIPLVYTLASMQAVSSYYAKFMLLVSFLMAAFFLSGLYFGEHVRTRKIIEYGLTGSAYLIVLFGLLNLFGQTYYPHALWLAHDGYRLSSVFQYSNTYAGFLVAIFLVSAYYATHCTRRYAQLLHAFMLVPIWISFMLTYSRGAIVIVPIMIILIMPFLRFSRQIAYIATSGAAILISMLLLGKLTANADAIAMLVQPTTEKEEATISLFSSLPIQSWSLLIAGAAVMTGLVWLYHWKAADWLETKTSKLASFKWSFAAMPAAIVVLTGAAAAALLGSSAIRNLLPAKLAERFANLNLQQHSVLERFTFYKDGLHLSQDYPIFGAGGGAWQAMFEQYQNNPYWSRQAHSYYVGVLVETGWLGLIVLLGLLAAVFFLYIRSYIRHPERRGSHFIFFIFSLTLLGHSVIDFDMSYVYISSMVFLCLGAMLAPYGKLAFRKNEAQPSQDGKAAIRFIYPAAIGLLTIVLLFMAVDEKSAMQKFNDAYALASNPQASADQLIKAIDKSIKASPKHTDFRIVKADWLEQFYTQTQDKQYLVQALQSLDTAKSHDPFNRLVLLAQQRLLHEDGQLDAELDLLAEGLVKFPWSVDFYDKAITAHYNAYTAALLGSHSNDAAKAAEHKERIESIYEELVRRSEQLSALPAEQQQGRAFGTTESIEQVMQQLSNN